MEVLFRNNCGCELRQAEVAQLLLQGGHVPYHNATVQTCGTSGAAVENMLQLPMELNFVTCAALVVMVHRPLMQF